VSQTGKGTFAGLNGGHTAGSILFQGAAGINQDNAIFYWDNTNKRMTVGTQSNSFLLAGVTYTTRLGVLNEGVTDAAGISVRRFGDSAGVGALCLWTRARGTAASPTVVADADTIAGIMGGGYDGTDYHIAGQMLIKVDGAPSNNVMPGRLEWYTNAGGSAVTLGMTLNKSQNLVIVGTVSASDIVTTPAVKSIPRSGASNTYISENWTMRNRVIQLRSTADVTITAAADQTWEVEDFKDSIFTHAASSAEVTIGKTGRFRFRCDATTQVTSGTVNCESTVWLQKDGGGGYATVAGTEREMFNRPAGSSRGSSSFEIMLSVTSGDKFKVSMVRSAGTATVASDGSWCVWIIEEVRGAAE